MIYGNSRSLLLRIFAAFAISLMCSSLLNGAQEPDCEKYVEEIETILDEDLLDIDLESLEQSLSKLSAGECLDFSQEIYLHLAYQLPYKTDEASSNKFIAIWTTLEKYLLDFSMPYVDQNINLDALVTGMKNSDYETKKLFEDLFHNTNIFNFLSKYGLPSQIDGAPLWFWAVLSENTELAKQIIEDSGHRVSKEEMNHAEYFSAIINLNFNKADQLIAAGVNPNQLGKNGKHIVEMINYWYGQNITLHLHGCDLGYRYKDQFSDFPTTRLIQWIDNIHTPNFNKEVISYPSKIPLLNLYMEYVSDLDEVFQLEKSLRRTCSPIRELSSGSALHLAVLGSSVDTGFLLNQGANPNNLNNEGITPLMLACQNSLYPKTIEHLLKNGADPNIANSLDNRNNALHYLVLSKNCWVIENWEKSQLKGYVPNIKYIYMFADLLFRYGLDLNAQNRNGDTALHLCFSEKPWIGMARHLIQLGANPTIKNNEGISVSTLPDYARCFEEEDSSIESSQEYLFLTDIMKLEDIRDTYGYFQKDSFISKLNGLSIDERLDLLLEFSRAHAVAYIHKDPMQTSLSLESEIPIFMSIVKSLRPRTSQFPKNFMFNIWLSKYFSPTVLKELESLGLRLELDGMPLSHFAVLVEEELKYNLLLEIGQPPVPEKDLLYMRALNAVETDDAILLDKLLMNNDLSLNYMHPRFDKSIWSQAVLKASYGCIKILLKEGIDIDSPVYLDTMARVALLQNVPKLNPNYSFINGNNFNTVPPLVALSAIHGGFSRSMIDRGRGGIDCWELLISREALVSDSIDLGIQPIHLASANGRDSVVNLLLESDALVMPRDDFGRTPLHYACASEESSSGILKTVKLLIENGADPDIEDNNGKRPIDYASSGKVIGYLKSIGVQE